MNDKLIKKLVKSATKNTRFPHEMGGYFHLDVFDKEKFAELIVKECILTIQQKVIRNGPTPGNQRSLMHISDLGDKFGITFPMDYYGEFGVKK